MVSLRRKIQTALLLSVVSTLLHASLTPYTMALKATKFGTVNLTVNGEQALQPNADGSWSLTLTTKNPLVSVFEQSTFAWMDNTSIPMRYHSNTRVALSRTKKTMEFDRTRSVVRIYDKDKANIFTLKEDVVDLGSFQVNLMQHFRAEFESLSAQASQEKITALIGESYAQLVQGWTKQSALEFSVVRLEVLDTPAGKLNTLLLYENNPKNPAVSKRYWVAVDYGFIPVKVEQYRNSKIESRIEIQSGQYGSVVITGLQ